MSPADYWAILDRGFRTGRLVDEGATAEGIEAYLDRLHAYIKIPKTPRPPTPSVRQHAASAPRTNRAINHA